MIPERSRFPRKVSPFPTFKINSNACTYKCRAYISDICLPTPWWILCNFGSDWNVIFPFILRIAWLRKYIVSIKYVTIPDFNNVGSGNDNILIIMLFKQIAVILPAGKYWSRGRPPPTSPWRPLKILFDRPGNVPIWRPGDVLKWLVS